MVQPPLRIISDIHWGHPASLVEAADQLKPLFEGVPTVVFNGDTVEMRFRSDRGEAEQRLAELEQVCSKAGVEHVMLNGNHDPFLSDINHLDLADGAILVTHGDMLFHDISPWSAEARQIGAAHTEALAQLSQDALADFESRLLALRRAALSIELHRSNLPQGSLARIAAFVRESWPPWRPLLIIRCWIVTPGHAVHLAEVFRPRAKFVIIGHTHFSGIWRKRGRTVINCGSFLPLSGRFAADIDPVGIRVRKIVRRHASFYLGDEVRYFELQPRNECMAAS
jgi:predicted phosphodiesterase